MKFEFNQLDLFQKGLLLGGGFAVLLLVAPYLGISAKPERQPASLYPVNASAQPPAEIPHPSPAAKQPRTDYTAKQPPTNSTAKQPRTKSTPQVTAPGEAKGLAELEELLR